MLARVAGLIAAELTTTTVILTSRFSHRNSFSLTHTDTDICTQAHTGSYTVNQSTLLTWHTAAATAATTTTVTTAILCLKKVPLCVQTKLSFTPCI